MKIRLLLLSCLLAGQGIPAMAMQSLGSEFMKADVQQWLYLISDLANSVYKEVNKDPSFKISAYCFTAGIAYLMLNKAYGNSIRHNIGNLKWKIGCDRGTISPNDHLLKAVECNDLQVAEWALNCGADPNGNEDPSSRPLLKAIWLANEEMIDLLIKSGADVNKDNSLYNALAMNGNGSFNIAIAKKLIEAGANPDMLITENGETVRQFALAKAVRTGNQAYINIFKPETKL